jgi:outer membrane protein TolC
VDVVAGIPADLLRRRPDIRRAERQVAAQSARIGIAAADFYPRFALTGTIGLAATQFGDMFQTPDSMFGAIGPSFRWDILNYGRILNNVRVQDARFQELAFAYENSVLQAGREVENSMIGFLNAQEQKARLESSVAAGRTVDITLSQYRLGAVDFTPLVLFESTLVEQQDQLVVARGAIALNLIAAYRALGGGWEMRLSRHCATGQPTSAPRVDSWVTRQEAPRQQRTQPLPDDSSTIQRTSATESIWRTRSSSTENR